MVTKYYILRRTNHELTTHDYEHGRRLRGGQGGFSPQLLGWGDIVSYIPPQHFDGKKKIFNAFSVLGCLNKKL